ncbi:DUF669 domain-containing protein [Bilifractor porci]|uniref:DUF669 domain-containing protein n=1 Tax=Bilifractor porci TaxID=2606636 RepID=A0A7X2P795_9FIRM|nr:DUF669 domain-containing protein [Bilifractor porci]MST81540.1 DUF669 domain-containing protein [Bilifractor porci]
MGVDFSAFNNRFSKDEIKKAEQRYKKFEEEHGNNYKEVPSGVYAVDVDKMEVGKSSWGAGQINITFVITDGDYKGQKLFYNGTFDDNFAHGEEQTARLIEGLTDCGISKETALLMQESSDVKENILDIYQEIHDKLSYDLDYDVKTSKKLNPNTNKPYVNKFFSIDAVYDK